MPRPDRAQYRRQAWPRPLLDRNPQGDPRRLGAELEFIGVTPQDAAEEVRRLFGGELDPISDYEIAVRDTRHGDYNVELDMTYLKERGRKRDAEGGSLEDVAEEVAEGVIALVAKQLVPVEIVTPPIPMNDLWELEDLVRAVRKLGGKGTTHSPQYAFGLHFNPELPALDGETLRRYLQAFLCLYPWLLRRSDVDLSRRITPYIDPFPRSYLKLVLQPDYVPDRATLIDDYLEHNATRNRALDMLPVFKHVDEDRVLAVVDDRRVKSRPTLHYRLPNCQLDEPEWQLVHPWRDLLQLDALAAQPKVLAEACAYCYERSDSLREWLFGNWAETAYDWVLPELL